MIVVGKARFIAGAVAAVLLGLVPLVCEGPMAGHDKVFFGDVLDGNDGGFGGSGYGVEGWLGRTVEAAVAGLR